MRIILHPGVPPLGTPAFDAWLQAWHAENNGTAALETRLHDTLVELATPPGLRRFSPAIEAAVKKNQDKIARVRKAVQSVKREALKQP